MFNVPANVTPDWAQAVEEIAEVMNRHWANGDHIRESTFSPEVQRRILAHVRVQRTQA